MRDRPEQWDPALAAQWICAAVHGMLGQSDLRDVPTLMSGYLSVLDHDAASDFGKIVFALRQLGVEASTKAQLRKLVESQARWVRDHQGDGEEQPFEIDLQSDDFAFRLRQGQERIAAGMMDSLMRGLPYRKREASYVDPTREFFVVPKADEGRRIAIHKLPGKLRPSTTPKHRFEHEPSGPISIPVEDLENLAREMDQIDAGYPDRAPGNWFRRLREETGEAKFQFLSSANGEMGQIDTIRLDGLQHLIGLPGSGKSTLITLILVWLDRHHYRTSVLVPSIQGARRLCADLRFYGCDAGLLFGRSPGTRIRHAEALAETIRSRGSGGFGKTLPLADHFSLGCMLPAFIKNPQDRADFPYLDPPCENLVQNGEDDTSGRRGRKDRLLCPLAAECGYHKASRTLTSRRIWIGHVQSTDTSIPPHFVERHINYFEAIAKTGDVVIVDEADGAQAALDGTAATSLLLTGDNKSLEATLGTEVGVATASGRNHITSSAFHQYKRNVHSFSNFSADLVRLLQETHREHDGHNPLDPLGKTFITSGKVLAELCLPDNAFSASEEEQRRNIKRLEAQQQFWEGCVYYAETRRIGEETEIDLHEVGRNSKTLAESMGMDHAEFRRATTDIVKLLRVWIGEEDEERREQAITRLQDVFQGLAPFREDLRPEAVSVLFRLLVCVTLLVTKFWTIKLSYRQMAAKKIHQEELPLTGISRTLDRTLPESLASHLSGIRYEIDSNGKRPRLKVQYVNFKGAPRLLLYHLHRLFRHDPPRQNRNGPNVLLASATSFLESSPTYHIPVGPHFVLRRTSSARSWRDSQYLMMTVPDRENGRPLRYSGALPERKDEILFRFIDYLCMSEDGRESRIRQLLNDGFDPGRGMAIVVNSYSEARKIKRYIARFYPELSREIIGVAKDFDAKGDSGWVTASEVETLNSRDDWSVIIFPMKSLSRGVNLVFEGGDRARDARIGTVIFLTRPHPAGESLSFASGVAGRATLQFDLRQFEAGFGIDGITTRLTRARHALMRDLEHIIRFRLQVGQLGHLARPFVADLIVDIIQTIGRGMRNDCKVRVIFVDAAWAPNSAPGSDRPETARTSMLVMMRDILREHLNDPDPVRRELYRELYEPFLHPLERCHGVNFPDREHD